MQGIDLRKCIILCNKVFLPSMAYEEILEQFIM